MGIEHDHMMARFAERNWNGGIGFLADTESPTPQTRRGGSALSSSYNGVASRRAQNSAA